jgi:hypothetical protein
MAKTKKNTLDSSNPSLFREIVKSRLPLIPAKYPTKPTPVHISNNFITCAMGEGSMKTELKSWVRDQGALSGQFQSSGENLKNDADALQEFFRAIFDSDGNVFKSMASPNPISQKVIGRDPTDDGYAVNLWHSLGSENREKITELLVKFYDESKESSSLKSLLDLVVSAPAVGSVALVSNENYTSVGKNVGEIIIDGLQKKLNQPLHIRLEVIRQLSTLLGVFVVLGMMFDACAEERKLDPDTAPHKILGTFVYTGSIGGRSSIEQKLSMLAVMSLRDTIERSYNGLHSVFLDMILEVKKGNNSGDWDSLAREFSTKYTSSNSAVEFIKVLNHFGEEGLTDLVESLYPITHLRSGIRSLGTKTGFVWPARREDPRLVLDSNFLTSLVSFLGEEDMPIEDFVAKVHDKLGLIIGYSGVSEEAILQLERIAGRRLEIRDLLLKSERHLSIRLVGAGLARQYSDGSTALLGGNI